MGALFASNQHHLKTFNTYGEDKKHWCFSQHIYTPRVLLQKFSDSVSIANSLAALVFVYDYHPGAETLLMRHFSGPDSTLAVSPDGTLLFPSNPRAGGVPNRHRPSGHRSPMPERLIWSYIIQLSSALRTVHAAGLACRVIDPSKILLIGNSRWVNFEVVFGHKINTMHNCGFHVQLKVNICRWCNNSSSLCFVGFIFTD